MMNPSQPGCETDEHRSLCLCLRGGGRKSSATCHMPRAHFGQAHPLFLMLPGVTVSLDTQRWKICLQKDGLAAGLRFPQGPSLGPVPDGYHASAASCCCLHTPADTQTAKPDQTPSCQAVAADQAASPSGSMFGMRLGKEEQELPGGSGPGLVTAVARVAYAARLLIPGPGISECHGRGLD